MNKLDLFDMFFLNDSTISNDRLLIDEANNILDFAIKQNMQPYVLRKLISIEYQDNRLLKQLTQDNRMIKVNFIKQFAFLKKIAYELDDPIIVVKGISSHLLNRKNIHIRHSNDLDILYKDLTKFENLLLSKGYIKGKGETGHELSLLHKDHLRIDLHKNVIVTKYPDDIGKIKETGECTISGLSFDRRILYEDVINYSIEVCYNVRVPNVTFSVLILCVSIFRDYITQYDKIPHFKLVNLLEIYLLTQDPNYNSDLLKELIEKYSAYQAIDFSGNAIKQIFQTDPFEKLLDSRMESYPQILLWNFFSWYIPNNLKETLFDNKFIRIINSINGALLEINDDNRLTFKNKDLSVHLKSRIEKGIEITLIVDNIDTLSLEIGISPVDPLEGKDIIHFEFGVFNTTLFGEEMLDNMERKSIDKDNHKLSFDYDKQSRKLNSVIDINNELLIRIKEEDIIPLSIFIEKHESESNNEINCLLPLLLAVNSKTLT